MDLNNMEAYVEWFPERDLLLGLHIMDSEWVDIKTKKVGVGTAILIGFIFVTIYIQIPHR